MTHTHAHARTHALTYTRHTWPTHSHPSSSHPLSFPLPLPLTQIESNHNKRILESIDLLSGLSEDERHAASEKFVERTFPKVRVVLG